MKANELPDKIYLFENPITETPDDRWLYKRSDENDIEYIRKDAFIEKACEFLNSSSILRDSGIVEKFKTYMKGE